MSDGLRALLDDPEDLEDFEELDESAEPLDEATGKLCWRCRAVPVRVFGVPCPECRVILDAEYEDKRRANGGKLLYLPDGDPQPMPTILQCAECTREFSWQPGVGRRPLRCPECRGDKKQRDVDRSSTPAPRPKTATDKTAVVRRVDKTPAAAIERAAAAAGLDVPTLRDAVSDEVDQLEHQIGVRLRLMRAIDAYLGTGK